MGSPLSLRTFTPEALRDWQQTAALVPSSRYLVRAMLGPLPLASARCAVEFGPGTGAMTRPLLADLPADARLLCLEINPRFCAYLRQTIPDPRLEVVSASATQLPALLAARGLQQVDAAISSLGLTSMPSRLRHAILEGLVQTMAPGGVLTQFQYLHSLLAYLPGEDGWERFTAARFLREYFSTVETEVVWLNLPPAFVLACRR